MLGIHRSVKNAIRQHFADKTIPRISNAQILIKSGHYTYSISRHDVLLSLECYCRMQLL